MPDGWRRERLADVVALQRGFDLPTPTRRRGRVPILGSFGVTGWHDEARAEGPGVTIGRSGASIGVATFSAVDFWPLNTALFVKDFRGNDPRWIYWTLHSINFAAYNSGSAQPSLNRNFLAQIPINVPPIEEQRRIGGVLGALDDLFDTNRRIAEDCTALWRAIVRDLLADASESAPLSDLADFVNGKNFTKDASGRGRPVIRTPEVRRGPEAGTVRSDADAPDVNVAQRGDTLFVWSGSLAVCRWMWEAALINQHVFKVHPKPGVPPWLVYGLIEHQMPWFLSLAADKATTMGHIKREHLDAAVPVPAADEIERLDLIVTPMWDEALQCGIAVQELERARNELLPLLMSGRVGVGAAFESIAG